MRPPNHWMDMVMLGEKHHVIQQIYAYLDCDVSHYRIGEFFQFEDSLYYRVDYQGHPLVLTFAWRGKEWEFLSSLCMVCDHMEDFKEEAG